MTWQFAHPGVLIALLALPMIALWRWLPSMRPRRTATFSFPNVATLVGGNRGWRRYLDPLPDALVLVAIGLVILALARPESVQPEEVVVEGIDIYLALDMSGSMRGIDLEMDELQNLERLGKQPLNRFEYAVATLRDFVRGRDWDRIGMVVFAKNAFLQFPLTLDRITILDMLDRLRLGDVDVGGTAIGNAIGRAVAGLKDSTAETKIIILITDGDRRGGNISPRQATQLAKELGIHIYPILVGKPGTALVPAGREIFSNRLTYREQEFPVNPELLQEIATETGGEYYRATDQERLEQDLHEILDRYERTRMRDASQVDPEEMFRPFVAWALALLALQFLLRFTLLRRFP